MFATRPARRPRPLHRRRWGFDIARGVSWTIDRASHSATPPRMSNVTASHRGHSPAGCDRRVAGLHTLTAIARSERPRERLVERGRRDHPEERFSTD